MITPDREVVILINQGIFKKYSNLYESIPEVGKIQQEIGVPLYVGIGMGLTAHQAETNCRDALCLAKTKADSNAYIIKAERVEKDAQGNITTIYATYDDKSKSGSGNEESLRKVKGTLHWVSAKHAQPVEVRIYERLFTVEQPDAEKETDFLNFVNPDSLKKVYAFAEPALSEVSVGEPIQFQRIGYFTKDQDSTAEKAVFNRTVTLKDSYKPE